MAKFNLGIRLNSISRQYGCIGGAILVIVMLVVRWTSGSPYFFLSQLRDDSVWLPVWLASLLWMLWYFVVGFVWGMLLCEVRCRAMPWAVWFYRGSLYFLVGLFFGFMWYPCLFRACMPFFSLFALALSLLFMCIATACWLRIHAMGGVILGGYCAWLLFVTLSQFVTLLNN